MKQPPVAGVDAGDDAVGIFQQHLVADDVYHHKTAARLVAINATHDRLLYAITCDLLHIDCPLPLMEIVLPLPGPHKAVVYGPGLLKIVKDSMKGKSFNKLICMI